MDKMESTAVKKAFDATHDNPMDPKKPALDMLLSKFSLPLPYLLSSL